MSRIIVKQLPKNITEEKLRALFGSKGSITDLQLKYTKDGKFRQFCFIGYQKEEEAQDAIKFYNNTCIQTSRIKVELSAALGSDDKPQAWSKYASEADRKPKSIAEKEQQPNESESKNKKSSQVDEILKKHKDDPAFQEFMKAHDRNRTLWANDADVVNEAVEKDEEQCEASDKDSGTEIDENDSDVDKEKVDSAHEAKNTVEKLAEKPISDLDYMKSLMSGKKPIEATKSKKETQKESKQKKANLELYTIKIRNIPYATKRQDILKFFKPLKPFSVRLPTTSNGFCYVGFKTEKEMMKAMLKHKSFLKGVQVFLTDFTEKNKITKEAKQTESKSDKSQNPKWAKQAESLHNEENIGDSGSIFFRNLAYTVTEDDLQQVFEKFGPIAEINLPVDTLTRQIKGFGTVTFVMPEHALQAFNKLDGTDFHGRLLHLLPGKNKDNDAEGNEQDAGLTFKQKKALKLKKTAQQTTSWNTLFLGPNAVAEILAKRFETSKEKILDTNDGGSSAAVRIALGETQIVIEMKQFLEEQGVHLDAFVSQKTKRSKTIILAKNLPADTKVSELTPIFAKFGPIGRLVLPPSGVTALIEFCDATEARKAFKSLAYSKFKNLPLYLEWAPENAFTKSLSGEPMIPKIEETPKEEATNKEDGTHVSQTTENTDNTENVEDEDEDKDTDPEPNTTLFLRNLNFKTVEKTVWEHFRHLGTIHTVEIAKRKDAENLKKLVSLGYGFIQFKRAATAAKALKVMQFTTIDGNSVELRRSDRILKTEVNTASRKAKATQQTGSKILVRNLAFQAKEKEVREIFKAFGELRSVRLPKKNTPGEEDHIRGFGFIDYVTKSDAKKAFAALGQSTHLYGRRLVLEWAAIDDEDVNELRKRTAEQVQQSSANQGIGKRRKLDVDVDIANDNEEY